MTNKTIQEAVAEKITKSGEDVANVVIDKLAEVEVSKRVDLVLKSVQKLEQIEKDFKKIDKNDVTTYVGGAPQEAMSKARFDEIKKGKEKIAKLSNAIDAALTGNNVDSYNKLAETLKKLDNANSGSKSEESSDSE